MKIIIFEWMNMSHAHKVSHCYVLGPFRGDYSIFQRTPRLFLLGIARPRLSPSAKASITNFLSIGVITGD